VPAIAVERDAWLRYSRLRVDAALSLRQALLADDAGDQRFALRRFEENLREAVRIADRARAEGGQ
jgi:hypothetical protein